jgi:hypothetical protein
MQAGLALHARFKIADQSADYVPTIRAANFDIALFVYAHDTLVSNASSHEIGMVEFARIDDFFERLTSHFNKRHHTTQSN